MTVVTIPAGGQSAGISLGAGDTVENAGTVLGTAAGVIVGVGGVVGNTGSITGVGADGVDLGAGGALTNAALGTITGNVIGVLDGVGGLVSNAGSIAGTTTNGVQVGANSTVTNEATGRISGYLSGINGDASVVVTNSGSLIGTGVSADGVFLGATSTITNNATGNISGAASGVAEGASGAVLNAGTITGANVDGIDVGASSNVTNTGAGNISGHLAGIAGGATTVVTNSGTIMGASGDAIDLGATGTVTNTASGTINGSASGIITGADGTVVNAGTITAGDGTAVSFGATGRNLLVVDQGAVFNGTVIGGATAINVLELGAGTGTLTGLSANFSNFQSIVVDAGAHWVITGGDPTLIPTVADGGSVTYDGVDFGTPCYCSGTHILTPSGEVPVEKLSIGDLLITRSGEPRPIKWIGRRSYAGRFIAGSRDVLPIRFAANSLGDGIPSRDLDVSPKHAMFIDDVLVPAEMLVNNTSVYQLDEVDSVEYFHLELAAHDVIFANGAASETFVDCDSRAMFHNAPDYTRLYPDDPGPAWQFCAPRVQSASALLVAILARLSARAGSPESVGPPGTLQGNIDHCDRLRVYGWVFDATQPARPVRLEVRCDGECVGHVVANRYRPDLKAVGYLGDGRCSFNFTLPIHLSPLSSHVIELLRAVDGAPMPASPVHLHAVSGLDAECRTAIAQMLSEAAQTATKASDLDAIIVDQMTQVEALLAARARLGMGARAEVTSLHDRWGGLVPTAAVRRSAPELRPQALFVDETFPAMGVSGGANAAIDHMRALLRIGFDVSFVASQDLGDRCGRAAELAALGIRPLLAPWFGSVEEVLRRHSGRIDAVYLHRAGNAVAYGKLVRQYCPRAHLVYGVADLHHLRLARQGTVENRPEVTRLAARLRIEELLAARFADIVITHSNAEAELLRAQVPGVTVVQVPWSVPIRQSSATFAERNGVVFVGHFGHAPNVDAVHWLTEEIVPLVQRREPAIEFRIVGRDMPEPLRLLSQPGLEMVGHVERLDEVFDAARLTVAPLRYGAGIKAKVIESLAAGLPCVGTTIAFEGMTLPSALTSCVADTPAAFAAALIRLYRDERAHTTAAMAGQRYALVNNGEACVDALMRQAMEPALRQWAGISGELGSSALELQMAV